MALTGDGEGRMRNDPLVISSIHQPIRGGWEADWPIRGSQGPPAPVSSMSINNTKLTSVLRRREKTQQILSTSKNTSLEIWLMDLMNERRRVNSGKHFSKGFWKNFKYFKENLKLSHPDIVGIQSETTSSSSNHPRQPIHIRSILMISGPGSWCLNLNN